MKMCITKLVKRMHQEQKVAMQRETTEVAVETTTTPAGEIVEDQEISIEQDIQGEVETQECTNLTTKLTLLK